MSLQSAGHLNVYSCGTQVLIAITASPQAKLSPQANESPQAKLPPQANNNPVLMAGQHLLKDSPGHLWLKAIAI